jgi:hypothetical protein
LICINLTAAQRAIVLGRKDMGALMNTVSANSIVLGMAVLLLLLAMIGYGLFVEFRRMLRYDGRLRLRRMLVRNGVAPSAVANEYYAVARATRRCVACADKARCDAWLAAHQREGFEAFCPNASFIAHSAQRVHA